MRASGELLQALVASAGVTPEIRIQGAPGLVEARFLESSNAILLIAINHAETPQKVTLTFTPDTPEAIWQNMETGMRRPVRPGRRRSHLPPHLRPARRHGSREKQAASLTEIAMRDSGFGESDRGSDSPTPRMHGLVAGVRDQAERHGGEEPAATEDVRQLEE